MKQEKKDGFKTWYAMSFALQLGFLIIAPIGGFIFLGILCDRFFNSTPFFLITGVAVGLVFTVYEVYHMLAPLIKNNNNDDD